MSFLIGGYVLRRPEDKDIEALYQQKNDSQVATLLGGFSLGYSREDIRQWIESHRARADEVIWVIADTGADRCVGHVGLYQIDHRVGSAEFAIMIGDVAVWGQGLGRRSTAFAMAYGFKELNLNRISLRFLDTNSRAKQLYESMGFQLEGTLRQAQYKQGRYIDVRLMSILRAEYLENEER